MTDPLVTEAQAAKALAYLGKTDESCAQALAFMKATEKNEKVIIAMGFDAEEGSAEARKQAALNTQSYKVWIVDYETAIVDYHLLRNKRERAVLTCELWRSVNANRARGNV